MPIANFALHYVIMPSATTIKPTKLFKRYVDDILFLSETLKVTDNIKRRLKCTFEEHNLKLVFRENIHKVLW